MSKKAKQNSKRRLWINVIRLQWWWQWYMNGMFLQPETKCTPISNCTNDIRTMIPIYFKIGNVTWCIVSDTSLSIYKNPCPCHIHGMPLPLGITRWKMLTIATLRLWVQVVLPRKKKCNINAIINIKIILILDLSNRRSLSNNLI